MSYWAKLCWFKKLSFKFLIFWVVWFIIDCVVLGYSRICIRDVWLLEIKNYFNVQKHNSVLLYMYVLLVNYILVVLSLMCESGWKEPLKFVLRWVSCATSGWRDGWGWLTRLAARLSHSLLTSCYTRILSNT